MVRLKAMVGPRAGAPAVYPRRRRGVRHTRKSQRASEIDPVEWIFNLLISNEAALFIAIIGASVFAIIWYLYRQD